MPVIRINAERLDEVRGVITYLHDVETAYNNLYVFHLLVDEVEKAYQPSGQSWERRTKRTPSLRTVSKAKVRGIVLPEDTLWLHRINIESPGFWEFLGALNPLETLRKYLADRHERIKDKQYRNQLEAEKMRLEVERLKTEVAKDRIDLLREVGVPEEKIRDALTRHLVEPLSVIDRHQDAGLILGAEIVNHEKRLPPR